MPNSGQTHIFATRSDLEPGLREVESEVGVKYARCDLYYGPICEQYPSLLEWNDLGRNETGSHITGPGFLVLPRDREIKIEPVPQVSGGIRYSLSQKLNPNSITFLPGGIYKREEILICGHIGTIWKPSLTLYKSFVKAVTKGFEKIGSYRVGPEAVRLMNAGHRMVTIGISSPRDYDLRRS